MGNILTMMKELLCRATVKVSQRDLPKRGCRSVDCGITKGELFVKMTVPCRPGQACTDVYYIVGRDSEVLDEVIGSRYEEIKGVFRGCGMNFYYAAKERVGVKEKLRSWLGYEMPYLTTADVRRMEAWVEGEGEALLHGELLADMPAGVDGSGGLIIFAKEGERYFISPGQRTSDGMIEYIRSVAGIIRDESGDKIRFKKCGGLFRDSEGYDIEAGFDYEAHRLADEIKEKIASLEQMGFGHLLRGQLQLNMKEKERPVEGVLIDRGPMLSRLEITSDYRILLPDYGIEIEMTPLPKSVYLLFLKHKDGIVLKEIGSYREDLLKLYKCVSGRNDLREINKSIEELTDPSKNSLNEKCSRIKEAFLKRLQDGLARHYYITGERGRPKTIQLPDECVKWNEMDLGTGSGRIGQKSDKTVATIERQGDEAYRNREYYQSIHYYTIILSETPERYEVLMKRAICYGELGFYGMAVEDNTRAIENSPQGADIAYHNRSESLLMLRRYEDALRDMTHYLRVYSPRCGESYFIRGMIYMRIGDITHACQDWYTAKTLGHGKAGQYLKQYPEEKIESPRYEMM